LNQANHFIVYNMIGLFLVFSSYDRAKVGIKITDKKENSKGDRSFVTWAWAVKNQDNVIIAQGENT
jgi:hypothetical protein